jgi:glycosyltransferase involved in cell wall biosynthesis
MNATPQSRPNLSVVVPCFDEAEVLLSAHERITRACRACVAASYEIIYVDDGSRDSTPDLLRTLARDDCHVRYARLSRNFGHQAALAAGLSLAGGERVLTLDADLQDPPELLPQMMERMDRGASVVYGVRTRRDGESWLTRITASAFYAFLDRLSDVPLPRDAGDFRLIDRPVLDAYRSLPEKRPYIRGLIAWVGFRQEGVPYVRAARAGGRSKYGLRRRVTLAIDAIAAFSTGPLRLSFSLSAACFMLGTLSLIAGALATDPDGLRALALILVGAIGWATAIQLIALGIIGEYVARSFAQAQGRPLYIIEEDSRSG